MTTINLQYGDMFKSVWTPFMDTLVSMASAEKLDSGLLLYVYGRESSYGTNPNMGANGPFQITPVANPWHLDVSDPPTGAKVAIELLLYHVSYWRYAVDAAAKVLASYNAGRGTVIHAAKWARTQPIGVTWRQFPGRSPAEGSLMQGARGYLTLDKRTIAYGTSLEVLP